MPEVIKEWIGEKGLEFVLDWVYQITIANFHSFHILRYAKSIDEAINIAKKGKRTMPTYAEISDGKNNQFVGLEYQPHNITVYSWENQTEYEFHPKFKDIVYWDKEFQPSQSPCFSDLLKKYEGEITAEIVATKKLPVVETGRILNVVWDFETRSFYAAFERYEEDWAHNKQLVKVDWDNLINQKQSGF